MKKLSLVAVILCLVLVFAWSVSIVAENNKEDVPLTADDINEMKANIYAEGLSFTVGINAATEKPLKKLVGLKIPKEVGTAPTLKTDNEKTNTKILTSFPASLDWRALNGVTPIRDQGNCGSCWTFGTVGPMECVIKIKDGVSVDLSEQNLLSCNPYGYSCNGGWFVHGLHVSPGAALESCFPYKAADIACTNCPKPYVLSGWGYVKGSNSVPRAADMKEIMYHYGPLGAAVAVDSYFQAYTGGIFNFNYTGGVNHAIVLVGYDDSQGYWILRNSWGTSWGESGYMRIKYGMSSVGYAANAVIYKGSPIQ